MSELFIDTNEPKTLKELQGMDKYITQMNKWYSTLNKKFILALHGDNGCGKTLLARLFLEDKGYNLLYFDISSYKSKTHIYDKIKESFKSYDIYSILLNQKKKLAYIIDNIDNSILSKNDIIELHTLFVKKETVSSLATTVKSILPVLRRHRKQLGKRYCHKSNPHPKAETRILSVQIFSAWWSTA